MSDSPPVSQEAIASLGATVVSRELLLLEVDAAFGALKGLAPADLRGQSIAALFPDLVTPIREVLASGITLSCVPVRGGESVAAPLRLSPLRSARGLVFGVELELERADARPAGDSGEQPEADVRVGEWHLSQALSVAKMGTWELDLQTRAVRRSASTDRLFGIDPDGGPRTADDYLSRVHPEDAPLVTEAIRRSVEGGAPHSVDYRVALPDGSVRWLASRGEVVADDEGAPRLIGALIDITARWAVEAEREELLARERAAVEARDSFIAIAAHDLRSPLTALLGQAELLERRVVQQAPHERLLRSAHAVADQARRLSRMLGALLDLSRIQSGQLTADLARLDLAALLARCVAETRPALTRHTLELVGPSEGVWVLGDEVRLEQVFLNLLANAVKYSPEGGAVTVCVERREGQARVAVSDEGIGIPAEALPQLFERFYRAANAGASGISGLGIGLYTVREILALHGGAIAVESAEGQGSTFTASLPLAPACADDGQEP